MTPEDTAVQLINSNSQLVESNNALANAISQKLVELDNAINTASATVTSNLLAATNTTINVDGVLGDDANDGAINSPIKTLDKAYELSRLSIASQITINVIRDGSYDLPQELSGSHLVKDITVTADKNLASTTYPDGLGVTLCIVGDYSFAATNHRIVGCRIDIKSTQNGVLIAPRINFDTYQCVVTKLSNVAYFLSNYSVPLGICFASLQTTIFDGNGSELYPIGRIDGTTMWTEQGTVYQNGALVHPDYQTIRNMRIY